MIEKPRFLPPDPMEVARRPIEGVDMPEEKDVRKVRKATEAPASGKGEELDESSEAAQRGRTA